jgi:hypothetical protein
MQTQKIHLGNALTIVTGKFLSPNGMRSLQDTLRYLADCLEKQQYEVLARLAVRLQKV